MLTIDLGDAPAPYPTTIAEDGARHTDVGLTLGATRDSELDGTHSANADADGADEDGVTFGTIQVGALGATATVNVQGAGGKLDAWIDFNGDSNWGGEGEQVFASQTVVVGNNNLTFDVPSFAKEGTTFARFRLSTAGNLGPEGLAVDGEVEDYAVTIISPPASDGFIAGLNTVSTGALGAISVFAADVDGDGDMDILSASYNDDKIAWYENDGSENFTAHTISTAADRAFSVVAADVDGDGDLDVLSASYTDDKIAWYENDGSQNFTAHTISTTADGARTVTTADLDGDGDLDVLSASRNGASNTGKLVWYENDGSQNFTAHTIATSANSSGTGVTAADIDGDGDLDVVGLFSSYYGGETVWYENDGNQNFTGHTIANNVSQSSTLITADLDGDGDLDVLSVANYVTKRVVWYENDGSQNFTTHEFASVPFGSIRGATVADVDGDDDFDIVVSFLGSGNSGSIWWYENDGSANFSPHTPFPGTSLADVTAADVDGDGDLDIVSAISSLDKIAWFENVPEAANLVVTTTADVSSQFDNVVSLREAINFANSNPGLDTISFAIPGAGVHTIQPGTLLPFITDPVIIDGTTQGVSPTPLIELDGTFGGTNGLQITAGGSTVKGLAINRFPVSGIRLEGLGGNTIQGNFIGTNAAGTADMGNALHGIFIAGSPGNLIGGTTAAARNVISGNNQNGVHIQGGNNLANVIQGNFIGTNAAGTAAIANTLNGVQVVHSSGNIIGGTTAGERNVISGNVQNGIHLTGSATTATIIRGNYIGTNAAGTADLGNTLSGVLVTTANNTIGGTVAGAGNVISGNNRFGITVQTTSATGNNVQGNLIGTNAAGTGAIGNSLSGITLYDAGSNTIGGTTAAARNVISGNLHSGVSLSQAGATNNLVRGNFIGTNINGTADLGNTLSGVYIDAKASSNTIGGTAAGARNIISGNNQHGVHLLGFGEAGVGVRSNLIQGNYIGTDVTGTADLGNSLDGVRVQATANTVGGASAAAANLISGNDQDGVRLQGGVNAATLVQGNFIGTKSDGTTALANGQNGVQIVNSSGNTIGGQSATAGNRIAFNALDGITLSGSGSATSSNTMWRNSIFSNGDLGIDLNSNGQTPNDVNDPDDGPNRLQNFPAFASAVLNGPNLDITYSVPSLPANSGYPMRIEFFIADASNQEGQTFLGSDNYAAPGAKLATIAAGGAVVGTKIVATATDANGNTSEFSLFATVT